MKKTSDWIDVSVTLKDGMVHWPSDPGVQIFNTRHFSKGDHAVVSQLTLGSHTGTHMDAPGHFIEGGKTLDSLPLSAVLGPARVIEIENPRRIEPDELKKKNIRSDERVLFKTLNSGRCWKTDEFIKDFVYISKEAAALLAELKVQTVGVDYLSVGGFGPEAEGRQTHLNLLGSGIWIIEGLDLSKVPAGDYELVCLPLKILNSDGAPARAALRPL